MSENNNIKLVLFPNEEKNAARTVHLNLKTVENLINQLENSGLGIGEETVYGPLVKSKEWLEKLTNKELSQLLDKTYEKARKFRKRTLDEKEHKKWLRVEIKLFDILNVLDKLPNEEFKTEVGLAATAEKGSIQDFNKDEEERAKNELYGLADNLMEKLSVFLAVKGKIV